MLISSYLWDIQYFIFNVEIRNHSKKRGVFRKALRVGKFKNKMKMKKSLLLMAFAAILLFACQPKTQTVDKSAVNEAVNTFMDKYLNLWNTKDVNLLTALLADDGQFYGTDPSEIMDKKTLSERWMKSFADTSANFSYTVEKRVILLAPDGNSAIVTEQFEMSPLTGLLKCRLVSQIVKSEDTWKIEYQSCSVLPKNEDLGKLITALK